MAKAITVLELAIHLGAKEDSEGGVSFAEIQRVGLSAMGGCEVCGATIAAYNASPCKTGFLRCTSSCTNGHGYETVEEAYVDAFPPVEDDGVDISEEEPTRGHAYYDGEDFCRGT